MKRSERVEVLQRQFAIATSAGNPASLATRNLLFCTSWLGFDRQNRVAFLCHFDTPWSVRRIQEVERALVGLVPAGSTFETHVVSGTWLAFPYSLLTRLLIRRAAVRLHNIRCTVTVHPFLVWRLRAAVLVNAQLCRWRSFSYVWERGPIIAKVPESFAKSERSA